MTQHAAMTTIDQRSLAGGPTLERDASTPNVDINAVGCDMRIRRVAAAPAAEIQPGDLFFGRRLSAVQRLNTLSGDSLTHSGIIIESASGLRVAEHGARGPFSRSLDEFIAAYPITAHLRPRMGEQCRHAAAHRALTLIEQPRTAYSWATVATIGWLSLARRVAPQAAERAVVAGSAVVARRVLDHVSERKVTCSSFLVQCLDAACVGCRPLLQWPVRPRVGPWRGMATPTDARRGATVVADVDGALARRMVTPTDLWVSVPSAFRSVTDRSGMTTMLIDLTDATTPSCRRA